MSPRVCLIVGALFAGLAVAAGTFGAHALPQLLERARGLTAGDDYSRAMANFETGARYQMYHALALLLVGLASERRPNIAWCVSAVSFTLGIVVFSGCLYALVLTGQRWLGAIVPIGGTAFLVGWLAALVAACQVPSREVFSDRI